MPDYGELKELHKSVLTTALRKFKEKAIGGEVDEMGTEVTLEVKKEFDLIKRRCLIETRRRCEAAVKNEIEELTRQIKTGTVATEADMSMKIDLLRQIMLEILKPVTFPEKESFVSVKCAEMASLA